MARGRGRTTAARRELGVSPQQAVAAAIMRREARRAEWRNRPPAGKLTSSPAADASASAKRMLAEQEARRADMLINAGLGAALQCRRCGSSGAVPMRIRHKTTKVWLAVLLCAECTVEGRAEGYVLAAYRP